MMQDLQISPKLYAYSKLTRKPRSPKPRGQQQQDNTTNTPRAAKITTYLKLIFLVMIDP
jgi:hypothetical protein